jgi:PAS domain S-box-containing protein
MMPPMPKTAQRSFSMTPAEHAAQPAWLSGKLIAAATLGSIALVLGATAGFLWLERERVLNERAELAARGAHRLATDLQQSLTVARTAIDQFNDRLQLASSQPFETPAAELAHSQTELLAVLPLPFGLRAIGSSNSDIALIGPTDKPADLQTRALRLLAVTAETHWGVGSTVGLPDKAMIPLVWRADPNTQGIVGYAVGLRFDALQRWLESELRNESDRASLFRMNNDGSATLLAWAPRVYAELGMNVTTEWVAHAAQNPTGIVDVISQFDGVARRVAYERLSGPADQLVLVYGASTQTALAVWTERLPYWVGLSLLLSLGIALAGWRLNRSLRELTLCERRFQLALDSGHVWDWDLETGLMRYAPSSLAQLGYTSVPQTSLAEKTSEIMLPEDRAQVAQALKEHLRNNKPYNVNFRLRDAQGQVHWFESTGQAFRNLAGRATYMAGTTFEITERRALAESRRQTLQQLDTVANASPVLFWTADLLGRVDWVNRCWVQFTGRAESDVMGDGLAQDVHPEDAAKRRQAVRLALANLQPYSLEYRLHHHSGTFRWVMEQCLPRLDADQQPVGFIGSCVDISELKRAEDAARARGAMLESVFEVLHDRLFVLDNSNRFIHYHGLEDEGLYVPSNMFLGKTVAEVVPRDVATAIEREMQKARLGQLCDFEYELDLPHLGLRHFNARGARIPNSDHCMLLTRDITEREELRSQQDRLHQLMQLQAKLASSFINLPIEEIDVGINQALADIGALVSADRVYIFIYHPGTFTACNTHEWCAQGIEPVIDQLQSVSMDLMPEWIAAHEQRKAFSIDDVMQLPAGSVRELLEPQGVRSLITLPMSSPNGRVGFVGFDSVRSTQHFDHDEISLLHLFAQMLLNVTERRTAEAKLRLLATELEQRVAERTQQLDISIKRLSQANRELESFAYSVSHDLKSPLRSVEGFASLLLQEHSEALNEEARHYLNRIQRATMHMARLISDLLAYCRIEELGRGLVPLRLTGSVSEVLEGMRNELEAQQALVRVNIAPELAAMAHPQGLAMVLRNLIDNAMKFARPGHTPEIEIEARMFGPLVRLSVCDQGIGFDMKHHDRIFAIFQRLHRPDQIAGTGIGLAMVHKAVERMEGRIWAQSTPGEGATFNIELPRA